MGVFTFLESYNFSGKTIYPLVTHGSDRFGKSLDAIRRLCPQAVLGEGFAVRANDRNQNDDPIVITPNRNISSWLHKIGITMQ
jgi:hypothetical protein